MPLEPVQIPGADDRQDVVIRAQETLDDGAAGRRGVPIVVQDELDAPEDAGVVEGHQRVPVPALDDAAVDGREVDLPELHEVRIGPPQHVVDRAPLIRDPPKGHEAHPVDDPRLLASGHQALLST